MAHYQNVGLFGPNKLSKRADNAKKYFNHILGGFKETSSNKTPFKGYIGWKLK